MQKNKKIKIFLITIMMYIISMSIPNIVKAASVSISAATSTASANQSVTVTISSDATGRVNISASNASVSTSEVWVEGGSQTITVTPNGAGNVIVTATPVNPMSLNGEKVYPAATSCTIKLKTESNSNSEATPTTNNSSSANTANTEKSNVATLSNLGIRPNDFSGFSPTKTSYSVTVPNEVESVEVYATKGQSGQTVSGTGTKKLAEGANAVNVTVTAEDGKTTKTYTINITRSIEDEDEEKEDEEEKPEEETENTEEVFGLKELKIEGLDLQPQFQPDIYEYKIELKEDLEKLNLSALATEENVNIEITGNENLQEGENIITIIVKSIDDEKTLAYQIIVNKVLNVEEDVSGQEQQEKLIMMAVIGGVIFIIVIVIIVVVVKRRKKESDSSMPYYNLLENPDLDELDNTYQENDEEEYYDEKPKKKKRSKGKRYK